MPDPDLAAWKRAARAAARRWPTHAEDLEQTILEHLWRRWLASPADLEHDEHVQRIAKDAIGTYWRQRFGRARGRIVYGPPVDEVDPSTPIDEVVADQLDAQAQVTAIADVLDQLPPNVQRYVHLRLEGLTDAQARARLGVRKQTLRVWKSKIRAAVNALHGS